MKLNVKGFTLIELLVVLAIASIMLGVIVPSFSSVVNANRVEARANIMMTAIASTRSEAIKTNENVTLCRSENKTACSSGSAWSDGWIIVDSDGDVVKSFKSAPNGFTFTTSSNLSDDITFKPSGELTTTGGSIIICGPEQVVDRGYQIFLNASGRARKEQGVTSC